ncbi:Trafficking protein particle complex subunit 31 [Nakaseomyces bracarensis]|uniref:Trafficking protein particle complex subunit n=1 Tax=Nakaseomyces bracarensis TaxID=273131 RepID=A0ABR4P014_9SACH
MSIYNESLIFKKNEVSLSAMVFLYQEMIVNIHNDCKDINEFETRLSQLGHNIGTRLIELLNFRASATFTSKNFLSSGSGSNAASSGSPSAPSSDQDGSLTNFINKMRRRDLKILDVLQFIHGSLWSYMFGHVSNDLVKSSERENEYMIVDNKPILTQFISGENVSCDYFVCGIIHGYLDGAGFPSKVTPHSMPQDGHDNRLVYLIQFDKQVLEREGLRLQQ